MDGSFLKELVKEISVNREVREIAGFPYHVSAQGASLIDTPMVDTHYCYSLTQLVNLVKYTCDGNENEFILNVKNFNVVTFHPATYNPVNRIETIAKADFSDVFDAFPTGEMLSQENMVLELMTKMERDPVTEAILKLISSVKAERLATSDDDGYSQTASFRTGVALTNEKDVKNLWQLRTYKTFPEIEQPLIPYVLRLHQRDEEMPKFSLNETGGGHWQVETTQKVRQFLFDQLGDQFKNLVLL